MDRTRPHRRYTLDRPISRDIRSDDRSPRPMHRRARLRRAAHGLVGRAAPIARSVAWVLGLCAVLVGADAAAPAPLLAQQPAGELSVVLFRETPCRPEPAALVTVERTRHVARSDSLGTAAFGRLPAGEYRVRIETGNDRALTRHVTVTASGRTVLAVDVAREPRHPL